MRLNPVCYYLGIVQDKTLESLCKKHWATIIETNNLGETFIQKFQDKMDWIRLSSFQLLSESFIRENKSKVEWGMISEFQDLSESFMLEFQENLNWGRICKGQTLSESFIRNHSFQLLLFWKIISQYQELSESFIREFQSQLSWNKIVKYQKISEAFIMEVSLKPDFSSHKAVLDNPYLGKSFKKKYNNQFKEYMDSSTVRSYLLGSNFLNSEAPKELSMMIFYVKWLLITIDIGSLVYCILPLSLPGQNVSMLLHNGYMVIVLITIFMRMVIVKKTGHPISSIMIIRESMMSLACIVEIYLLSTTTIAWTAILPAATRLAILKWW